MLDIIYDVQLLNYHIELLRVDCILISGKIKNLLFLGLNTILTMEVWPKKYQLLGSFFCLIFTQKFKNITILPIR